MKLHLTNCCLNTSIRFNRNIIFLQIPMKTNKNTANACACYENMANNTMHIVQDLHTFL